ncbi:MAG: SPFH domain-containing protein, partial [Thermoproteota archaeon]
KTVLRDVLGHAELDDLLTKTHELTKQIQQELDEMTDPWGIKVTAVVISDIILPVEMQRAIAKQAEAERERRSRIIVAEGEYMAAEKMAEAAKLYERNPIALKLRELQTLAEISREKNLIVVTSTTDLRELGNIVAMTRAATESGEQVKR